MDKNLKSDAIDKLSTTSFKIKVKFKPMTTADKQKDNGLASDLSASLRVDQGSWVEV